MSEGSGAAAFAAALTRCGANPRELNGHIAYVVEPVEGALAGEIVETAVSIQELARWPLVPPHWVHLPASVRFAATNSQPSALPGWLQHSRQIAGWGRDADPAAGWLAHVRAVVGEAR